MKKNNIVLIGMPSSGKSTIGKRLSQELAMDFIDTDTLIKQRENKELRDIVNTSGLEKFLEIQDEVLSAVNVHNCIIATGGSVVYNANGLQHLADIGIVFYLELNFEEVEARITTPRRFARGNEQSFYDVFMERKPLYEKYSFITVKCSGKSVNEIVEEIKDKIHSKLK
jgi:shikimate kinase